MVQTLTANSHCVEPQLRSMPHEVTFDVGTHLEPVELQRARPRSMRYQIALSITQWPPVKSVASKI